LRNTDSLSLTHLFLTFFSHRWSKEYGVTLGKKTKDTRVAMLEALEPYAAGILDPYRPAHNLPLEKPTFTLSDLRNAIPKHCLERSLLTSMGHLVTDLILVATMFHLGYTFLSGNDFPLWVNVLVWPVYWYLQGAFMTGVWVIAHECGHQGFSPYESVNNFVGTILHSLLLVPYHSWRITHGKHHSNTGNVLFVLSC
jgi:omega-6 fatty acid desaturase (delta-12 desaturase)